MSRLGVESEQQSTDPKNLTANGDCNKSKRSINRRHRFDGSDPEAYYPSLPNKILFFLKNLIICLEILFFYANIPRLCNFIARPD
jgi:hypothetical protein